MYDSNSARKFKIKFGETMSQSPLVRRSVGSKELSDSFMDCVCGYAFKCRMLYSPSHGLACLYVDISGSDSCDSAAALQRSVVDDTGVYLTMFT